MQWGYQTEIASYFVLFPTPKTRSLELLGSKPFKAKLEEPTLKQGIKILNWALWVQDQIGQGSFSF